MWYLDDGVLAETIAAVRALILLKELLPWRGLDLNHSKCKLFGPGASDVDAAFDGIPRYSLDEGTVVLGVPAMPPLLTNVSTMSAQSPIRSAICDSFVQTSQNTNCCPHTQMCPKIENKMEVEKVQSSI